MPGYLTAVSVAHGLLNSFAAKCEQYFAYGEIKCIARKMMHTISAKIMVFCCPISIINQYNRLVLFNISWLITLRWNVLFKNGQVL